MIGIGPNGIRNTYGLAVFAAGVAFVALIAVIAFYSTFMRGC